ncbi:MAG TPA: discoidin domain-containing protein [Opitutaceae bacterium]|nr:discoidin domain-containing protein [Opitutaceae bacterium]
MNKFTCSLLLSASMLTGSVLTHAAPFDSNRVADNTKWLAHVDVEGLKKSSIGAFLIETAKAEMAKKNDSKLSIDVERLLEEVQSITAYGTTFEDQPEANSVLMIQAGAKAQAMVDGYLASQELANDGKVPFKTVTGKGFPTYLLANEVYMTFPRKDLIVISKEFGQVERALAVVDGKTPRLRKDSPLLNSATSRGFFFVASANGFNQLKDMPPQARILQKATGVQVALGESASNLAARITLSTADADVSSQMRRIVEGMLALVSFAQVEDQNLARLTQSITVDHTDTAVSIGLSYPVEEAKKLMLSLANDERPARTAPKRPTASTPPPVADAIGGERLKVANVDAKSDNGNLARNATDADSDTYWGANGRMPWIRCELEGASILREVQIAWTKGNDKRMRFQVQASPNGSTWTTIFDGRTSGEGANVESHNVTDTTTRWVRILVTGAVSNDSVIGISDLRFIGVPNAVELAAPEAVTATKTGS